MKEHIPLVPPPIEPRPLESEARPDRPPLFGSLPGGPAAHLALASIALPLCLGLTLQSVAPRGSREPLRTRMRTSGRVGLALTLAGLTLAGVEVSWDAYT